MACVTLRYKGQVILELNNLGSKTLKTAGKYCEADIELDYINYCPRSEQETQFDIGAFFDRWIPRGGAQSGQPTELTALHTDVTHGYVSNGTWRLYEPETCYSDIYPVEANKAYLIKLGTAVGNRFRVMFSTTDVSQATSNVSGISIAGNDGPSAYESCFFQAAQNGYITIQKTSASETGIKTFVYEEEMI